MFRFDIPEVMYTDPWSASFSDRIKRFLRGSPRVAYYYEDPDNSTFRYRVYNMLQSLGLSGSGCSGAYFTEKDVPELDRVIDQTDTLVVCRARYTGFLNRLITRAHNRGKRVLYDIDDLVFHPGLIHLIMDTLDQDYNSGAPLDYWFSYIGRINAALRLCDGVITTNEFLARQIRSLARKPVYIIPNFLNREQLELSRCIFHEKQRTGFAQDDYLHLGYFSGTPTHNKDLRLIADTLVELLENHPALRLLVAGFMDIQKPLTDFSDRIDRLPMIDFLNLQRMIGRTEINLIPLQENIFTNSKSELKYFEAGIVGTVSVATPTVPFQQAIRHGKNGFLAPILDWREILESLLEQMEMYPRLSEQAFSDCEAQYAPEQHTAKIEKTLFQPE